MCQLDYKFMKIDWESSHTHIMRKPATKFMWTMPSSEYVTNGNQIDDNRTNVYRSKQKNAI